MHIKILQEVKIKELVSLQVEFNFLTYQTKFQTKVQFKDNTTINF